MAGEITVKVVVDTAAIQKELIDLLREIRPNYSDVGSRDVDTTRKRRQIDRAIELLQDAATTRDAARYRMARIHAYRFGISDPTPEEFDAVCDHYVDAVQANIR